MSRIPQRKEAVAHVRIEPDQDDRRLDNFLRARFQDVPKSRIYQMIRKGEVRVNGGRAKPAYRLQSGDELRLPPINRVARTVRPPPPAETVREVTAAVLFENEDLLVINKPSGIPVHGGTGRSFGIIDALRQGHAAGAALQLVHRLDQETSGCLLLAKNHPCLRRMHQLLRDGLLEKQYLTLLKGTLGKAAVSVNLPLQKNVGQGGKRRVETTETGKRASTRFKSVRRFHDATLADVTIATGRTHQIRVHASLIAHPVAGDHRYGDREFNRVLKPLGLRRLFLHAARVRIPSSGGWPALTVDAPLPDDLSAFLDTYE